MILTNNKFYSSSFHRPKSTIYGSPRRCLIHNFYRNFVSSFQQPFSSPQSRKNFHCFLQSISASHDCRIFCIQICNDVAVVMSNLSLGLDPSSISVTCPLILDISKSNSKVFNKSGKLQVHLGFYLDLYSATGEKITMTRSHMHLPNL
jgi:hypothetical protein